jgi:LacI family transcriptional regulator
MIAGIEYVCSQNKHHVIICQSHESYKKELEAIDMLIRQNVDCILISLSTRTESGKHLKQITDNGISLVQLDRFDDSIQSHIVENNNKEIAFEAVRHLVNQQYKRIAYIGGPEYLKTYLDRKQGFLAAIKHFKIPVNDKLVSNVALSSAKAKQVALRLLSAKQPPDAFFTASDYGALGVLQAANQLRLAVPSSLGIVGFQNEGFTKIISPTITTIDQRSVDLGKISASLYFSNLDGTNKKPSRQTVNCELIPRQSSQPTKKSKR